MDTDAKLPDENTAALIPVLLIPALVKLPGTANS